MCNSISELEDLLNECDDDDCSPTDLECLRVVRATMAEGWPDDNSAVLSVKLLSGETRMIAVSLLCSAAIISQKLQDELGDDAWKCRFIFDGQALDTQRTLLDYGIVNGSTIYAILMPPRGRSRSRSKGKKTVVVVEKKSAKKGSTRRAARNKQLIVQRDYLKGNPDALKAVGGDRKSVV